MNKELTYEFFPARGVSACRLVVDFINRHQIKQEDIQSIVPGPGEYLTLFYWRTLL